MYAVVIPSGSVSNLNQCLAQILIMEPGSKDIIVVGDDLDWTKVEYKPICINGKQPFIFATNCNVGMHYALTRTDADGVIILGDDGLLMHPLGFTKLEAVAREHTEYGIIAAATNNCGNRDQMWRTDDDLREISEAVAFICVYIPRAVIEEVCYMDERFTGYGFDDDDYCRRVRDAGLTVGVYDGCKVNHYCLPSVFRTKGIDIEVNKAIYEDKWNTSE